VPHRPGLLGRFRFDVDLAVPPAAVAIQIGHSVRVAALRTQELSLPSRVVVVVGFLTVAVWFVGAVAPSITRSTENPHQHDLEELARKLRRVSAWMFVLLVLPAVAYLAIKSA
jgi:hypothetical protein